MKYNGIVEAKLRIIEEKLSDIEDWNITSLAVLQGSSMLQNAVERALQVSIESIIDAGERILAIEKQPAGNTSSDVIYKLQDLGIISKDPDYIAMIKFRNFIVHRYEKIDLEIIYATVKKKLPVFRKFIDEIRST